MKSSPILAVNSDPAREAGFCLGLVTRGETIESVRRLIAISPGEEKFLRKRLSRLVVNRLVLYRRQVMEEFDHLIEARR